jgi:hypothetical protein
MAIHSMEAFRERRRRQHIVTKLFAERVVSDETLATFTPEIIDEVEHGGELFVTSLGKIVAELSPVLIWEVPPEIARKARMMGDDEIPPLC